MIWRTLPLSHRACRYETNTTRATWSRGNIGIRERESGYLRAKGTDGKAHRRLTMAEINNARWRPNWRHWSWGRWTVQRQLCNVLYMWHHGEAPRVVAASTAIKVHRQPAKTCTTTPWHRKTESLVARHMHSMPSVASFMHGRLLLDVQKTCIVILHHPS